MNTIYGNPVSEHLEHKAVASREKYQKKFGDDTNTEYHLALKHNAVLDEVGCQDLVLSDTPLDLSSVTNPMIIGNIRMGFGHYRISMAMASCARHLGYTPLWLDLNSFPETTMTKIIASQNDLYSLGSRISSKSKLFNKLVWEPMNYEGFRQLKQNISDQEMTRCCTPIFRDIDHDIPYIATHVWPSQAAVHAGMTHVVNAIPDNWQMALHLSEGATSCIQTPNSYFGYRTLRGMQKKDILKPMPHNALQYTGHYIDWELLETLEDTCKNRIQRANDHKPIRYLLTVGGAGSQQELFIGILKKLIPLAEQNEAIVYVNVGDHKNVYDNLIKAMPELATCDCHFNNYAEVKSFIAGAEKEDARGIHFFYSENIFEAVYSTNLLMNVSDLLVTKPSELAFYPIPKLFIPRVGGHEQWGAVHSAEIGDGTYECRSLAEVLNMIDLFQSDRSIIALMSENIIKNNQIGIYNGGLNAVRIAGSLK